MNSDSCMIIMTMDRGVAPSALRSPISRVRSLTTISMMLPTPTAPAKIVPIATIQLNTLMPVNSPWTLSNSSWRLKLPNTPLSSGLTFLICERYFFTSVLGDARVDAGLRDDHEAAVPASLVERITQRVVR